MGKKRKASVRRSEDSTPKPYDAADGNLGPVRTYEDIADSEDEFHLNRDKIFLDDDPDAKRQRRLQENDSFLDQSDVEVLGHASESSEDEEEYEEEEARKKPKKPKKPKKSSKVVDIMPQEDEHDEDAEGWGSSKRDYYNADCIETEADALEEETEAKKIQRKKLQKMSEADFGFDEEELLEPEKDDGKEDTVTEEILKEIEIPADASKEERARLLNIRYPEFNQMADEFLELQPTLQKLQADAEQPDAPHTAVVKLRALAAYVASLTMYFAILTSTANESEGGKARALNPLELHDHPVMHSLRYGRELWTKASKLQIEAHPFVEEAHLFSDKESPSVPGSAMKTPKVTKSKKQIAQEVAATQAMVQRTRQIHQAEKELADLSDLLSKPSKKISKRRAEQAPVDDDSDFGEDETMDAREAEEKAQKKKSLRFYTSQIAQKANRRADAGRDAGGDADLPYRERLKDRQARLQAEAEKRGKKLDKNGRGDRTALGDDSDDEDKATAAAVRDDENDYYDMIAHATKAKKAAKAKRSEAHAAATAEGKLVREVTGEVDAEGKRAIGYVIEKNKGLAPSRKKEVRNPRVKKRMRYEAKMKKLSTVRAVYKGGESKAGYGGELTGIKTNLVKSVKLG